MKLDIVWTSRFKKDYKQMIKRGCKQEDFRKVVEILITNKPLPDKYRDHSLSGNYNGFRECHINPDWLLIYQIDNDILTLTLTRTGTHSDLF